MKTRRWALSKLLFVTGILVFSSLSVWELLHMQQRQLAGPESPAFTAVTQLPLGSATKGEATTTTAAVHRARLGGATTAAAGPRSIASSCAAVARGDATALAAFPDEVVANDRGRRQQRGASSPLVTGDGFRSLCRSSSSSSSSSSSAGPPQQPLLLLDDTSPVGPLLARVRALMAASSPSVLPAHGSSSRRNGSALTIFVQTHFVETFIDQVLPVLFPESSSTTTSSPVALTLVTHNSDYSAPYEPSNTRLKPGVRSGYNKQRRLLLDHPRLERWYAQNPSVTHPKLVPLPIGVENRYNKYGQFPEVYLAALCDASQRSNAAEERRRANSGTSDDGGQPTKKLLFVSFSIKTNKAERSSAMRAAEALDPALVTVVPLQGKKVPASSAKDTLQRYLAQLGQHRFVLAPHGHGLDTHRFWEALYCGAVPVVLRSAMDEKLLRRVPVLLVDDYSEVTAARLQGFRVDPGLWATARQTVLDMSWWEREICPSGGGSV